MSFWARHQVLEKNSILLVIGILLVIAIGGIVEIAPLFYLKSTIERGSIRCVTCHSSEYLPPTRTRSGPVRFDPHWKGRSYMLSAASE